MLSNSSPTCISPSCKHKFHRLHASTVVTDTSTDAVLRPSECIFQRQSNNFSCALISSIVSYYQLTPKAFQVTNGLENSRVSITRTCVDFCGPNGPTKGILDIQRIVSQRNHTVMQLKINELHVCSAYVEYIHAGTHSPRCNEGIGNLGLGPPMVARSVNEITCMELLCVVSLTAFLNDDRHVMSSRSLKHRTTSCFRARSGSKAYSKTRSLFICTN